MAAPPDSDAMFIELVTSMKEQLSAMQTFFAEALSSQKQSFTEALSSQQREIASLKEELTIIRSKASSPTPPALDQQAIENHDPGLNNGLKPVNYTNRLQIPTVEITPPSFVSASPTRPSQEHAVLGTCHLKNMPS